MMSDTVVTAYEKVQIVDARLKLCIQKLNPAVIMAHENMMKTPLLSILILDQK